jgi:hypothetical protein
MKNGKEQAYSPNKSALRAKGGTISKMELFDAGIVFQGLSHSFF